MTKKYKLLIEVETETDPREWYWGETLIIDEPYKVREVREIN